MTIVWVSGWWDSLLLSRLDRFERYRQEEHRTDSTQQQAARRIGEECAVPFAPVHIVTECLSAQIESYEKQRDTGQDAQAQLDMALWAEWTFKATAVGIVLSGIGLFLVLLSLRQTRLAITTDREVGHAQVRAYMGFEIDPAAHVLPGVIPKVSFKIINTGQSPAYKVRHMSFLDDFEHPLLDWQGSLVEEYPEQKSPRVTVRAGGHFTVDASYERKLSQELFDLISNDGPRRIYLVAKVVYEDVFKAEHVSELTAFLEIKYRKLPDNKFAGKFDWILSHVRNDAT
jgi:hypothetical protein